MLRIKDPPRVKQETTQCSEGFLRLLNWLLDCWFTGEQLSSPATSTSDRAYFVTACNVLGSMISPRCVITLSTRPYSFASSAEMIAVAVSVALDPFDGLAGVLRQQLVHLAREGTESRCA